MLKFYSVTLLIFLSVCTNNANAQNIEENCFPEFTQSPSWFFDISEDDPVYIWVINGVNNETETPFLVKNGIKGFLVPTKTTSQMESISQTAKLNVTGRVFKSKPSWAERNFGGGEKNIKLEVVVEGKAYLIFDYHIPMDLMSKLPSRCTFK